jgi:hypothetical protein
MKKPLLITVLILSYCINLLAQEEQPLRYIFSGEVNRKQSLESEEIYAKKIEIEQYNYKFIEQGIVTPKILPVVFHIMYKDEHDVISTDMIIAQLDALNRDFGKPIINKEKIASNHQQFMQLATNPNIQFCLAQSDPDGNETPGIIYHRLFNESWSLSDSIFNPFEGGIAPWDNERYINIWVAKMQPDIYGYAQNPGGYKENDGIVIDKSAFGVQTEQNMHYGHNEGKLLTHLMGNYLGLTSIWGDFPCGDDHLWDTPVHNAPNFGYLGPGQVSSCELYGHNLEMTENFMDSTPDSIRYMFTPLQVNRMHATLSESGTRAGLSKNGVKMQCDYRNKPELTIPERDAKTIQSGIKIEIFPNPAVDLLCIRVFSDDNSKLDLQVFNSIGMLIHKQNVIYDQVVINLNEWSSGSYFFKFTKENKIIELRTVNLTH